MFCQRAAENQTMLHVKSRSQQSLALALRTISDSIMQLEMQEGHHQNALIPQMKTSLLHLTFIGTLLCLLTSEARAIDADLGRFSIAKQQQIRDFADTITNKVPAIVWRFYDALRVDDWETATNLAIRINMASHRYTEATNDDTITPALGTLIWPPISESYGAYEQFHE